MSNVTFGTALSGEYRVVVKSSNGMERDTGWFPNLILDQGLNRMATTYNMLQYASVGTGTTPVSASQISLVTPIAYTGIPGANPVQRRFVSAVNSGAPDYSTQHTWEYTFIQGTVSGNISEVGVGSTNSANNLFSRALILDTLGNPTTISITTLDQLIIYYRVTVKPPIVDGTGSVVLGGITYNYTTRLLKADTFAVSPFYMEDFNYLTFFYNSQVFGPNTSLVPITSVTLPGTSASAVTASTAGSTSPTYVPGTFYRDWIFRHGPTLGNSVGGIKGIKINSGGPYESACYQVVFDTPIPKNDTNALVLTFRYSWGRG